MWGINWLFRVWCLARKHPLVLEHREKDCASWVCLHCGVVRGVTTFDRPRPKVRYPSPSSSGPRPHPLT